MKLFDKLVKNNLVSLPEPRPPEELGRTDDSKYCPYHQLISHSIYRIEAEKIKDLVDNWIMSLPPT